MKTWIEEAREAIQKNNQEKIAAILLKKNILDTLMNGYETYLTTIKNEQQLKIIEEKKDRDRAISKYSSCETR
jgi:hypothetical protein